MVIGITLFTWDTQIGPVLEFTFPGTFQMTDDVVTKIYSAHSINEDNVENPELIEMKVDEMIYWSYCERARVAQYGYEILVLVFNEHEKAPFNKLKTRFINFAHLIFKHEKTERLSYIENNLDLLFEKKNEQKILLLGRAGTGKSSMKKVIFEGKNPYKLLFTPIEPTLDLEPSIYSWLDVSLGVFDSSGQEIQSVLQEGQLQDLAFENAAVVIYTIDIAAWINDKSEIVSDIDTIKQILVNKSIASKLIIFLNKIDLIASDQRKEFLEPIKTELEEQGCIIFLTSIVPELIYQTYQAFSEILSYFSLIAKKLKSFLDKDFGIFTKTAAFISNFNKTIIAQTISPDFDLQLINPANEIIAQLIYSFENLQEEDTIDFISLASKNGLRIFLKHLDFGEFDVADLIIVTRAMSGETFSTLAREFKDTMFNHFYNKLSNDIS
jgi:GTPase SAR1 family protein